MRPATPAEIGRWDRLVAANPDGGHMLQTRAWGEFKRRWGWRPAYMVSDDPAAPVAALWLRKRVRGLGSVWYSPKGPGVASADQLGRLLADPTAFPGAMVLEVEPELPDSPENRAALAALGLRKVEDVQISRATAVVDLAPAEADILASFGRTTRYNIGLAARRGVTVTVERCEPPATDALYRLVATAFRRGEYPLRRPDYYAQGWRLFEASGQGAMLVARLGDEVLAGAFVTWLGEKGWNKDGGSSDRHRELKAPQLLQWEAMRFIRARGVRSYDLYAVPPPDQVASGQHPLHGLWEFKTGFTSDVREFVGAWGLVLDPGRHAAWKRLVEPVVRRARWRLRHDLLY